jgi:hypothetical protein
MFEEKVGKFIDEVVKMLEPLSDKEVSQACEIHEHVTAFANYFELPTILELSYWIRLKELFLRGFEAILLWRYSVRRSLTNDDKKELIEQFCRVFSPDEYDQVFEKAKIDIKDTIKIVKVVI